LKVIKDLSVRSVYVPRVMLTAIKYLQDDESLRSRRIVNYSCARWKWRTSAFSVDRTLQVGN